MATDCQDSSSQTPTIKTQNPLQENSSPQSLLSSSSKGKYKLEFETNCCGICLTEAAQDDNSVSRGYIDSCDHYFCFVCIMEWAKVESKCPLCKGRFSTISRPAKPPVFPSDRLFHVPVRDQVYHYSGNATIAPLDPYSEAKCSACQSTVDESLLLLCDLCDSAAHTYCVGLGATVPEGDWFCHDCTLLRDEYNKGDIDTDSKDQSNSSNFDGSQSVRGPVSIFDIVREPQRVVERSSACHLSVNLATNGEISFEDNTTVVDSRRQANSVQEATKLAARTLQRCRNVHGHIQALRDNWISFRQGSLTFSSIKSNSDSKPEIGVDSVHQSSTYCASQKLKSNTSSISRNKDSSEIDKAWKMMDLAKSKEKRKSTVCQASKDLSSKHLSSNSQHVGFENLAGIKQERHCGFPYVGKDINMSTQMPGKQKLSKRAFENASTSFAVSPPPIYCKLISSQDVQRPIQHDVHYGNGRKSPERISLGTPSTVSNKCRMSLSTSSSVEPAPEASSLFHVNLELHSPSSSKKESSIVKVGRKKSHVDPKAGQNSDTKCEIQSLVKLNLKLLTKEKKLEVDVFKEVARLATHSILAACGLENPKPGMHPFLSSGCSHEKDSQLFRRSTLMPNSCRECFYVFVKDIVTTIMFEKVGYKNMS